ncbi:MAG: GNAT family N-acetyltransferase [Pseudomonadota bacterium]
MTDITISDSTAEDIARIQQIVEETGLFPPELVPDLMDPFLDSETSEFWRSAKVGHVLVGFCYTVPEMLAEGAWNIAAIAVDSSNQGAGIGAAMLADVEEGLRGRSQRLVLVDTSSTEDFARTRDFYVKNGFDEEARIRDFWSDGDDKVVFRKAL